METITASEARANFAEILGRVSFGKERITIERSGKPVALLVPVPDAGSTAIDNDITERQRAEERFRRYFDLPLVGSAIYAPDKKWIAVNDTLCDLLGYIMETDYGLEMPRRLQIEFSGIVQTAADGSGKELTSEDIWRAFASEYLDQPGPYRLTGYKTIPIEGQAEQRDVTATVEQAGREIEIGGRGSGPIDAFVDALGRHAGIALRVADYHEHAVGEGADAEAVAYLDLVSGEVRLFGVGRHRNITAASISAVVSGVNRLIKGG